MNFVSRRSGSNKYGRKLQPTVMRQHRPDYQIVLYMGLLMLLGLIIMYAIGPQQAIVKSSATGGSLGSTHFFTKQTISLFLALGAFLVMAKLPYHLSQLRFSRF